MVADLSRSAVEELLNRAGIAVDGSAPHDIRVHNAKFFGRVLRGGSLAFGESYMDGWWDAEALDLLFARLLRAQVTERSLPNPRMFWDDLRARATNLHSRRRAFQVGQQHYDLGNDLYEAMLDRRMLYTCGYWKEARTLDEAQEAKLELVCRKIGLEPGMTVLELGCGFGSFARYAAEKHGARVLGVTISRRQAEWGQAAAKGLPVEIRVQDYREVEGTFDRVISIGLLEHVGYKNYRTYMEVVNRTLARDGVAFAHTIGGNRSVTRVDAWLGKYIFPNGMLPSIAQLGKAMEGIFVMEDWHNFGPDYHRTLMAWDANFRAAWPELRARYDERFYRMWRYYLNCCAGAFLCRHNQLWQIVMTRDGTPQPPCRVS